MDYNPYDEMNIFRIKHKFKFPCLFELCLKFLSIPAASLGPVERLFSFAGYINRSHRARMTTKNFEKTTVLNWAAIGEADDFIL